MLEPLALLLALATGAPAPDPAAHPWAFMSVETLDARHPTTEGFTRVEAAPGTFGAFLRGLPMAPPEAPVVAYDGTPLYGTGHHEHIAGVVDIDVGARDLQQCADAVLRMHAEWRWGRGERDLVYHAASGLALSYRRFLAGERVVTSGATWRLEPAARARKDDHAALRTWLDEVFTWANTASLARESREVPFAEVRPGDFFVLTGSPFGHAVLVLDVAKDDRGRTALLLGQSFMPAQSFQVLRPSSSSTWFVVQPGDAFVSTPFWQPFPMRSLRRLP